MPKSKRDSVSRTRRAASTRKERPSQLERTAFHEAGHAIMALVHGRVFRHVTIQPDEKSLGHVLYGAFSKRFDPDCDTSLRTNHLIEVAVDCALAGQIAEALLTGRTNRLGSSEDDVNAINMASYRCGSSEQIESYLEWRSTVVRDTLRLPARWNAVRCLAEALLARKRLGYKEARTVYFEGLALRSPLLTSPFDNVPSDHAVGPDAATATLAGGA